MDVAFPVRAHHAPVVKGVLRSQPEDFHVQEWLGFEADGDGDHFLLTVRKRGANTLWVARALARYVKASPRDVGFSGLKDRDAVTEQAFTVPAMKMPVEAWSDFKGDGFEVIAAARHRRKIRRGAHKGNRFRIVVRDTVADAGVLQERLEGIRALGVPNYFGPQRFGRNGGNLQVAREWFQQGSEPRDRLQRGFALSAARAALFNSVLAARVEQSTWGTLLDGDVANLDGSGSVFDVVSVDAVLRERCRTLDIHPTGPLWGRGELRTQGAVAAFESQIPELFTGLRQGLASAGLEQERRALRIAVHDLAWTLDGAMLSLEFRLHRGAFATAVLNEIVAANSLAEEGDDA
jgi:tRNA pseudouridine13 synthase